MTEEKIDIIGLLKYMKKAYDKKSEEVLSEKVLSLKDLAKISAPSDIQKIKCKEEIDTESFYDYIKIKLFSLYSNMLGNKEGIAIVKLTPYRYGDVEINLLVDEDESVLDPGVIAVVKFGGDDSKTIELKDYLETVITTALIGGDHKVTCDYGKVKFNGRTLSNKLLEEDIKELPYDIKTFEYRLGFSYNSKEIEMKMILNSERYAKTEGGAPLICHKLAYTKLSHNVQEVTLTNERTHNLVICDDAIKTGVMRGGISNILSTLDLMLDIQDSHGTVYGK